MERSRSASEPVTPLLVAESHEVPMQTSSTPASATKKRKMDLPSLASDDVVPGNTTENSSSSGTHKKASRDPESKNNASTSTSNRPPAEGNGGAARVDRSVGQKSQPQRMRGEDEKVACPVDDKSPISDSTQSNGSGSIGNGTATPSSGELVKEPPAPIATSSKKRKGGSGRASPTKEVPPLVAESDRSAGPSAEKKPEGKLTTASSAPNLLKVSASTPNAKHGSPERKRDASATSTSKKAAVAAVEGSKKTASTAAATPSPTESPTALGATDVDANNAGSPKLKTLEETHVESHPAPVGDTSGRSASVEQPAALTQAAVTVKEAVAEKDGGGSQSEKAAPVEAEASALSSKPPGEAAAAAAAAKAPAAPLEGADEVNSKARAATEAESLSAKPSTPRLLRAASLLDLEVKVLTQPLGTENQWRDIGDGRVEFRGFTIRVVAAPPKASGLTSTVHISSDGNHESSEGAIGVDSLEALPPFQIAAATETPWNATLRTSGDADAPSGQDQAASRPAGGNKAKEPAAAETQENLRSGHSSTDDDEDLHKLDAVLELITDPISSKESGAAGGGDGGPQPPVNTADDPAKTGGDGGKVNHPANKAVAPNAKDDDDVDDDDEEDDVDDDSSSSLSCDEVILEDIINEETPFVGENCCIVWNSLDQHLSLCLMFLEDQGYVAAWSALVALQHKTYPPIQFDLLERCLANAEEPAQEPDVESSVGGSYMEHSWVPYSYFIHDSYTPPLGFIERHALSLSIMENGHALKPALFGTLEQCLTVLSIANVDLLEHLLTEDVYPLLVKGLGCATDPPTWSIPTGLAKLRVPKDFSSLISKDLRLNHLKHEALPKGIANDIILLIDGLSHRLQNEAVCALLSDDALLAQAVEALLIVPPSVPSWVKNVSSKDRPGSGFSPRQEDATAAAASGNGGGTSASNYYQVVLEEVKKAEHQVLVHLHFFRNLVSLAIMAFAKDLIPPVISKIFHFNLLDALSVVAERFAMPPGSLPAAIPSAPSAAGATTAGRRSSSGAAGLRERKISGNPEPLMLFPQAQMLSLGSSTDDDDDAGDSRPNGRQVPAAPTHLSRSVITNNVTNSLYSPAIEQELAAFLDVTIVRLNEKQEEGLMNEIIRVPIVEDPVKYHGLIMFMLRQLVSTPSTNPTSALSHSISAGSGGITASHPLGGAMRRTGGTTNPYLLYHVMGLHEDEGYSAAERAIDAEGVDKRNRFQTLIISRYLLMACKGPITSVPPAPVSGKVLSKLAATSPTTQPSSAAVANGIPLGISSPLIRVLEYTVLLASVENRELLVNAIFGKKSRVLQYIEACCDAAVTNSKLVSPEVLCSNIRFLRSVFAQMNPINRRTDSLLGAPGTFHSDATFSFTSPMLNKATTTLICRTLTVERDTFAYLFKAYNAIGGKRRRSTMFHSALLALLGYIDSFQGPTLLDNSGHNTLRDVADFLFFKHSAIMPLRFANRFRETLLNDVMLRLGVNNEPQSPTLSTSAISLTSTQLLTCTKQRPPQQVDELEVPPDAKALDEISGSTRKMRALIGSITPTPPHSPPLQPISLVTSASPLSPLPHTPVPVREQSRSPSPLERLLPSGDTPAIVLEKKVNGVLSDNAEISSSSRNGSGPAPGTKPTTAPAPNSATALPPISVIVPPQAISVLNPGHVTPAKPGWLPINGAGNGNVEDVPLAREKTLHMEANALSALLAPVQLAPLEENADVVSSPLSGSAKREKKGTSAAKDVTSPVKPVAPGPSKGKQTPLTRRTSSSALQPKPLSSQNSPTPSSATEP